MMATLATAAAAAIGGGAQIAGSIIQANAADRNTEAQLQAAREQQAAQERERARIQKELQAVAVKSPNEIASIDSLLKQKQKILEYSASSIDKMQALLDSFDPSVKEAGQQLYQTLKGESSKYLEPLTAQRARQKAELESNLARTLGPGWRTSSAGIEAINRFDQQSYEAQSQVMQNQLGSLAGIVQAGVNTRATGEGTIQNLFGAGLRADESILTAEHNIKAREMNAISGAATVAPINFGAIQDASKSVGQGDTILGSGIASAGKQLSNIGASLLGQQVGQANQLQTLQQLGFGSTPGMASSSLVGGSLNPGQLQLQAPTFGASVLGY